MPDDKKYTVKQFAARLRDEYDLAGDDSTDEELVSGYVKKHPEAMNQLPRIKTKAEHEVETRGGFGQELWGGLTEGFKGLPSRMAGAVKESDPEKIKAANKQFVSGLRPDKMLLNSLNLPKIGESMEKKNYGRAIGQAAIPAAGIASMATGAVEGSLGGAAKTSTSVLDEVSRIGEGSVVDKAAMDVARVATKPVSIALDGQIAEIEKAMANQHINAQRLTAGIAYEKQVLAKMEQMPATQLKDLRAAQEVVGDLDKAITGKKIMSWTDARQALKKIHLAKLKLGDKDILSKIEKPLEEELMDSAKTAGHGDVYGQWVKDYRKMSNVQRAYAKSLKGTTEPQMRTKLTAKGAPAPRVLGTTVRLGRSRLGKITKANTDILKKMDKAIDQLHKEVKGRTGPTAPPPATPIPAPPSGGPQGGGLPPVSGGSGPEPPEGMGGPMSGLESLKKVGPIQPVSETQQALNDLLKPVQRPPLPPNVVVGEQMGAKITEPGTGPARILPWPKKQE